MSASRQDGKSTRMAGDKLAQACWKGYEAYGFKVKDGQKVPNCVPIRKD